MTEIQARLLLHPEAYAEPVEHVRMLQTHTSWVFLTGSYAYKVKKPVYFGFLDYTTLDARKFFCEEELRLNQRLSPDIYCGVEPIAEQNGLVRVGGAGNIIDYCIKMKELPQGAIMTEHLLERTLSYAIVDEIARIVARFHSEAATDADISKFGDLETVKFNWDENFAQTEEFCGKTISRQAFTRIREAVERFMTERRALFEERIAGQHIRECHGDLHSQNIFVSETGFDLSIRSGQAESCPEARPGAAEEAGSPQSGGRVRIFDCIEFNRRFSCCDTASEIAFFVMDLEYYGEKDLASYFVDRYVNLTGDWQVLQLLAFYKCYRAYVRGKVTSFNLKDPGMNRKEKARARAVAQRYFRLADRYAQSMYQRPALILVMGLPGVGKTYLGLRVARRQNAYHLRSDAVRKELMAVPVGEHRQDASGKGIYTSNVSARTYEEMLRRARLYMENGCSAILDATFSFASSREEARSIALGLGARFLMVYCECPVRVALERINRRKDEFSFSDATAEVYFHIRNNYDSLGRSRHLVRVRTDRPTRESLAKIEAALLRL